MSCNIDIKRAGELISKVKSATIFCHIRPDGDTLGACVAMYHYLTGKGLNAEIVCESDIPERYFSFPFIEKMKDAFKKQPTIENATLISLDCAESHRMGINEQYYLKAKTTRINIDHHISNTRYADYNLVQDVAACCQILTNVFLAMGETITTDMANALMLGLSTDTGNFYHASVTPETFMVAAELVKRGADLHNICFEMYKKQKKQRLILHGMSMQKVRMFLDERLAIITVTKENLEKSGAEPSMTEGFIDFPLSIDTVEVAICLLEVGDNKYKASLRSKGNADVNAIAGVYGGGGHVVASGCMIFGEYEEVIDKLVYTVSQYLD